MQLVQLFSLFSGVMHMGSCSPSSSNTENTTPVEETNPEPEEIEEVEEEEEEETCYEYFSAAADYAPIQTAESPLPSAALFKQWEMPTSYTAAVHFAGTAGEHADHEGIDYIHGDESVSEVSVSAASYGTVVYVRTGCPQTDLFSANQSVRECGSGWGNHVVIDHGDDVMTRYAHLVPGSVNVSVGDVVYKGDEIALMGNSGRSELRHLHFEMGTMDEVMDPCAASQSFDYVYDPSALSQLHP